MNQQNSSESNYDKAPVSYQRRLGAIKIQLHSPLPSDVRRGFEQARKLLQDDPSNSEIYPLLVTAAKEIPSQREEIRNLLHSLVLMGSTLAIETLKELDIIENSTHLNTDWADNPSGKPIHEEKQRLIEDADDAFYAAEFEKAINLYRKVLQQEPNNKRAQQQLEKADLNRIAGQLDRKLPRAAMQYYRRARSYIAARDINSAVSMLNAAIEEAQASGMKFLEAEDLLNSQQGLQIASEFKAQAIELLQEEKWDKALEQYDRILRLDSVDETSRSMREIIGNLLDAEALSMTLSDQLDDETARKEKLEKIASSIKGGERISRLINTHRFKSIRAEYSLYKTEADLHKWGFFMALAPWRRLNETERAAKDILSPNNPALIYIDTQLRRIRPIRISLMIVLWVLIIIGVVSLFFVFKI